MDDCPGPCDKVIERPIIRQITHHPLDPAMLMLGYAARQRLCRNVSLRKAVKHCLPHKAGPPSQSKGRRAAQTSTI